MVMHIKNMNVLDLFSNSIGLVYPFCHPKFYRECCVEEEGCCTKKFVLKNLY